MVSEGPNKWFVCPRPNLGAEMRLFLFPYAGGGPASFGKWAAEFPPAIEMWVAHYPGRGSRHKEPPLNHLPTLADRLADAIRPHLDQPYAFFGHSLGGLLAFELARRLVQQNLPQPGILFVSACGAPGTLDPHPPIHALPDGEFLNSLQALNGIPAEIANLPELLELLLPALRADFEAAENYQFVSNDPPLNCSIIALGGLDDPRVGRERLAGWAQHTNAFFKSQSFPGDHFFIQPAREAVIAFLTAELSALRA